MVDKYTVLYRTYPTQAEAELNAADVRRNGSPCIAKPNPDQSNPYALWAIFVEPFEMVDAETARERNRMSRDLDPTLDN